MMIKSRNNLYFGIIVLIIGAVYLAMAVKLPRTGGIDSATIPLILSSFITMLGVLQIAFALLASRREAQRAKSLNSEIIAVARAGKTDCGCSIEPAAKPDYRLVVVTGVLIFLYVALLDTLGFMVMSALYLFVQIAVLTPRYVRANYIKYGVIALVVSVCVYYVFFWAFDIMLPHGEVWYDLGVNFEWSPFE